MPGHPDVAADPVTAGDPAAGTAHTAGGNCQATLSKLTCYFGLVAGGRAPPRHPRAWGKCKIRRKSDCCALLMLLRWLPTHGVPITTWLGSVRGVRAPRLVLRLANSTSHLSHHAGSLAKSRASSSRVSSH